MLLNSSGNSLKAEKSCFEKGEKLGSVKVFVKMLKNDGKNHKKSLPLFSFSCPSLNLDLLVLTFTELPGLV